MTHEEYLVDRTRLDELNKAIDDAPMTAKPVFRGICELHQRVTKYERALALTNGGRASG